jgi:hypothetical protein
MEECEIFFESLRRSTRWRQAEYQIAAAYKLGEANIWPFSPRPLGLKKMPPSPADLELAHLSLDR